MRPLLRIAPLLAVVLLVAGCGRDGGGSGSQVPVVATTTQVADMVAQVGGDRVDVERLLEPNSDPHDFEPRPSDAEAIARAQLVVRSGGDLDEWLGDLVEGAGAHPAVVTMIDHVETIEGGHGHEEEEGAHAEEDADEIDPHWWHDPRNGVRAVSAIRDALIEADPGGRETYEANARAYAKQLERLDEDIARCFEVISPERRKLVTTHDALGHFAARYDIEAIGSVLDSLSTQAQPSAGDTQRLVEQMREEAVRVVFAESSVAPRLEQALADEAGAEVGDALWADTLGPEGSAGDTYAKSLAANADAMARGFSGRGCELAPAR